ncbi:MAG TPA: hypothetical protein VNG33_17155 [Polyangiaceae bacterium]|nr:hypothetical protein [Polyangiaceae bacterium]
MTQSERLWTIVALVDVAILFAVVALVAMRKRARRHQAELRRHFGPEYAHAIEELGTPQRAERELAQRTKRVEHFHFHDLSAANRQRFADAWHKIQENFVDDPVVAVTSANELINQVMRARGYPVEHFEQRVADLSVEHPNVVQHYRAAHELSRSVHNGTVDTEELRQAFVHYRYLFAELLQEGVPVALDYRAQAS